MKKLLLGFLALHLVGCATITHDNSQKIKIETFTQQGEVISGADCTLANDFSTVTGKSGDAIQIHRSNKDTAISCVSAGRENATGVIISSTNAGMFGNILIGGAIGVYVDHKTGSAYTYPEWIRLVFGEHRAYDESKEVSGKVLLGEISNTKLIVTGSHSAPSTPSKPAKKTDSQQPAPIASGYASIDDVDALPYLNEKGREAYRNWLNKAPPKAFAISTDGKYGETRSTVSREPELPSDPRERAMKLCEKFAKQPCKMYAINNSVVWPKTETGTATSAKTTTSPTQSYRPPQPVATGFADIIDSTAIPYLNDQGRNAYTSWLLQPAPKAFAIAPGGHYAMTSGLKPKEPDLPIDPLERALQMCLRFAKEPCTLYAVNNTVVWPKNGPTATAPVVVTPVVAVPVVAVPVVAVPVATAPVTTAPVTTAPVTTAPVAAAPVTQAPATTNTRSTPEPVATGFARIDDVEAIPYLNDNGRNTYRTWLATPTPRAFAISSNGWLAWTSGFKPGLPDLPADPSERALRICEQSAQQPCQLYAVNNAVVWPKANPATANKATARNNVKTNPVANSMTP